MRELGKTGLKVSLLGVGQAELTSLEPNDESVARVGRVLNAALDAGINFVDTAPCYGNSEELIGRAVAHRRDEFILASKAGHATGGYDGEPWTAQTVRDSIDRSLVRLKTDRLDLLQIHTCTLELLERGEVTQAVLDAKREGKTRFVGFSGDNEAALWAVESCLFDTLQTSYNLVDQSPRTAVFDAAEARGMGVILKRPIANAVWRASHSRSPYGDEYLRRAESMARMGPVPGEPDDRTLTALGFALAHPAVDTAILGTANPDHMMANIAMVETKLPIASEVVEELQRRFDELGADWRGRT